jgi:UDP-N-acetyl-D-mannosaminuronic acid dehydrogenase
MNVLVVGACGRVGLPFSVIASKNMNVVGYDRNDELVKQLNSGKFPYIENTIGDYSAETLLQTRLKADTLTFVSDKDKALKLATTSDVIVIMVGTPIDSELNPRVDDLIQVLDDFFPYIEKNNNKPVVILRSTVSPGTTEMLAKKYNNKMPIFYCPERVSQGNSFIEIPKYPQIVSGVTDDDLLISQDTELKAKVFQFFRKLGVPECRWLTPLEAELAKLMTNMYRYVNFALANEFFMIAANLGADYEEIRLAINKDYPRMNLEKAGFAAGPCLFKDGQFLLEGIQYSDLVRTSFTINEGMVDVIANWVHHIYDCKNVAILGMTFKANSDDTRNSLSFKLKKSLKKKGINVVCYDPLWKDNNPDDLEKVKGCDGVVLMAPHDCFDEQFFDDNLEHDKMIIIDIWKHFAISKYAENGIVEF